MNLHNIFARRLRLFGWVLFVSVLGFEASAMAQIRIMPLGDSIVRGENGVTPFVGFRKPLATRLTNDGINFDYVGGLSDTDGTFDGDHEGHSGFTADQIDTQVGGYLTANPPDMVLLHIGTNDISLGQDNASTLAEISSIIDRIYNFDTTIDILVSGLVPRTDAKDPLTESLNTDIQDLVVTRAAQGYRVYFVNHYYVFKSDPNWQTNLMSDNVHPSEAGYDLMAQVYYTQIKNILGGATVTDDFNRTEIGPTWVTDPEYGIVNGELANTSTNNVWGHLAVYVGQTDAKSVSFTWGTGVDQPGINEAAFAVMLDSATVNANGYMVWRSDGTYNFWEIINGEPAVFLPTASATQPFPQPGDEMKVVMSSDSDGHHFDVYINGNFDARLTDPNKRRGNTSPLYAGVMLKGALNNNIDNWNFVPNTDGISPSATTDLTVTNVTASSATLQWTVVGDDTTSGQATSFDIRYSESPITEANFATASQVQNPPTPLAPGSVQTFIVTGLQQSTTYYFALKTLDEVGNASPISNVPNATTTAATATVDDFERASLGSDWTAGPEFQIIGGELANTATDNSWNHLAVFNKKRNPTDVALRWGLTADAAGINEGGLAVMLSGPSTTANGYLIWHSSDGMINLWTIVGGQPSQSLLPVAGQAPNPGPGDEFKVSIRTTESGHFFDVFVNGQLDGTVSDPNKTFGNEPELYSGVMLKGSLNNNIDEFSVVVPIGSPSNLVEVWGNNQQATVGTILPDSFVVAVTDEFGNPVSNVPVKFSVIQGNGMLLSPQADDNIRIEAESGTLTFPMVTGTDPAASDSTFIEVPLGAGFDSGGQVSLSVFVPVTGDYYIWGRVQGSLDHDSFYTSLDGGPKRIWDIQTNGGWLWDLVNDRFGSDPLIFTMSAGTHTLRIEARADGVALDKILLTTDPSYVPSGTENVGAPVTDAAGQAFTYLKLDTTAGVNKVQAESTGLTGSPIIFSATGIADVAATITLTSGNNQQGVPGQPLANPFVVTVLDRYGNPVPNFAVTFVVTEGGGTLSNNQPVLTDSSGRASTVLTLGTQQAINTVEARATGLTGSPVIFTATALPGDPEKLVKYTADSGDGQTGTVGKPLPKPFKVQVTDVIGSPVAGFNVTFTVTSGGGNFGGQPAVTVSTDSAGIAQATLTLGPTPAATNTAEATASFGGNPLTGSPVGFTATAAAPQQLARVSADTSNGMANAPLADSVKVKVLDALGAALPNFPVTFSVTEGGGKVNGSTSPQTVQTDASGIARAQWTLGPNAGNFNNKMQVRATFNGADLSGSPMLFVASANPGTAANLEKVSGDSLTGVIQNPLPSPFVVRVTDGVNPVEGWPVTFTVIQGGGKIDGLDQKTVLTGSNGQAAVTLTLGNSAGQWNNVVHATSENGGNPLNGSPVRFVASAAASNARNLVLVQGQNQAGRAGEQLPQAIEVKVTDEQQNPIQSHPVVFTVIQGGGTIGPVGGGTNIAATNDTTLVVATDPNGVAAVVWSLGGAIGDSAQVLEVRANDGVNELNNSPMRFYASATAGPVDPDASTIVATSPVPADGQTKSEITVTLTDAFGNPIPGKAVFVSVSDPNDIPEQPLVPTDQNGQVTAFLKTTRAGWKTVSARDINDAIDLNTTALIHFTPLEPETMALQSGDNQSGNIGTTLPQPLEVLVTDRFGNPSPGGEITFTVTEGGGSILEPQPVVSDTNGIARVHWVLGQTPGTNTAEAQASLSGSPITFTATGVTGVASRVEMVSGNDQRGPAGGRLPQPVVVRVTDASGQPVWNHPVTFVVIFDGQQTTNDTIADVTTDYRGEAKATWRLGPTVGLNFLEARAPGLAGSPVTFRAESFPGTATRMASVGGTNRNATVGNWSGTLRVQVLDQVGNPVEGTPVLFSILQGEGASLSQDSDLSDESGYADTRLMLGTKTGEYVVEARVDGLYGSPVIFRIQGLAAAAKVMSILSGNDQTGTINRPLPLPLEVQVVDIYDNPKPGVPLNFVVSKGGGSLAESQPVTTDAFGVGRVTWTIGPSTAANDNEVTVINNDVPGSPLIFRASGVSNNNYPQFNTMPLAYAIRELEFLQFQVGATDDDGDPLTYSAVEKPEGSSFGTSGGAQTFSWTPDYSQAGIHRVVLRVDDNKGGFDQETILVTVENVNRPPSVQPHPAQLDTNITVGTSQRFWVDAIDPDGDPVYYMWMDSAFDPDSVVSSTNEYLLEVNEPGLREITAFVFDLSDTAKIVWRTTVKTGVQLSVFSATAAEFEGIRLEWQTASEVENVGFNVLRARSENGNYAVINDELIRSRADGQYRFVDTEVRPGVRYFYMIEDIDARGTATRHGPVSASIAPPQEFALSQNYPNPFNPETTLRYQLPKAAPVTITVYNLLGQKVRTLVDADKEAGYHTVRWDGRDDNGLPVGSGVYYYRIVADRFTDAKKMVLIR